MEAALDMHIIRCLANDPKSQEWLYHYCFVHLMKVSLRYHCNEVDAAASFNKAMHRVFDKLSTYRRDGPFTAWVRKIVVNTCLNDIRKTIHYPVQEIDEDQPVSKPVPASVYSTISEKEIMALVQSLPDTTRLVFNLYVMEGYTHPQIAELLKIPAGTSKWQLNRARTILKEQIKLLEKNEITTDARS